jgi:integrase
MTTEKVQEFLDRLKDEDDLSASSVNHYRTILNSIFNEAVRHGRYDTNPVRAIHQFREPPGRDRFLSVEEFRLLLDKCKDPELRTVILVLCMTTLRLRELLNRRWAEVHLEGRAPFIAVPHTKTGVPKKTPLPRVAAEALKALPSWASTTTCSPLRRRRNGRTRRSRIAGTWASRSGPSSGRWESKTSASTTSGTRDLRSC